MPLTTINGVPMYFNIEGSGTPILFIHPPLLTSDTFKYQRELADCFQIITFDIRGHGQSGASSTTITYEQISDDIIELLNFLHIKKCFICGYSTGGSIALEAMLEHPNRFFGGILVSALSEVRDAWLWTRIVVAEALTTFQAKKTLALAITIGNSDKFSTFTNLYDQAKQGHTRSMNQYYGYSKIYNCTDRLKMLNLPQLLIFGQNDKGFYQYAKILERELPQNDLYFIYKGKHQIPTKYHVKMNRLIRHWIAKYQSQQIEIPAIHDEFNLEQANQNVLQ